MSILNVEEVAKYYEYRKEEFRKKGLSKKNLYEALEGVHHEALAFDILMGFLIHEGIKVEFEIEDFNPLIEDSFGVKCEIDFRLRVEDETLLFGATRFNFNDRDSAKDIRDVDIPIWDVHVNGELQAEGYSKISSIQSFDGIIRRKMAVRVAREGKHEFLNDYIYFMFWYEHPYAPWPDRVSEDFKFEDSSLDSYYLQEKSFAGICLVGAAPHSTQLVDGTKLIVKTHVFQRAKPITRKILEKLDGRRIISF